MRRYIELFLALLTGFIFGSLAITAAVLQLEAEEKAERSPTAVCVPLYDRLPNEHWIPGPGCPGPNGEQ